jgi:hypothetical protein
MVLGQVTRPVFLHHMHPEAVSWPHALGGSGQCSGGKLSLLFVFVAQGGISGVPRSLLLIHVGEGLASVVDYLV